MMADEPLSPPQVRAIEALLTHDTQIAAAKAARVGERSIRRWLRQDSFRAELARQRIRLVEEAASILARGAARAAGALVKMAVGEIRASSSRVMAARAVVEQAARIVEAADFAARLAELERRPPQRGTLQ